MTTQTYSLAEFAAQVMGPGPDGTPETVEQSKLDWLMRRLRGQARPQLPGYKVARQWRFTDEDVEVAIQLLRPARVDIPVVPAVSSMTRTSRRRLASA